ncbi:helix-turn-helix transcriptional regulator [Sorangium sp. So ce341]|uniref:helix-turn-helix transcriptional regulator n=1 Tax=Sorangium sp. So ce341 TaxID=3133302 RepID=UPI003F5E0CF7
MSRALRVMELSDLLRARGTTTVGELAVALGVSARTVRRDLATLRERGLNVEGEAGPGGGIRLDAGRGVTAVHLSVAEIVTLWLAARLSQAASDLPWSSAASSALAKLLGSLPPERARELRALCRRVIVGEPASAPVIAGAGAPPAELVRLFEESFSSGVGLAFDYRDREGRPSRRHVEPHGLLVQSPVWYVLALDTGKNEPRMFRMDRISRPRVLREIGFRPNADVIRALLPKECAWRPLLGDHP